MNRMYSPSAARIPSRTAAPFPRFCSWRSTCGGIATPVAFLAASAVPSERGVIGAPDRNLPPVELRPPRREVGVSHDQPAAAARRNVNPQPVRGELVRAGCAEGGMRSGHGVLLDWDQSEPAGVEPARR